MRHIPYVLLLEKEEVFIQLVRESLGRICPQYQLGVSKEKRRAFSTLLDESRKRSVTLPDVILLNLDLPQEEGWKFLKKIKCHPEFRRIPLVGFTEHARDSQLSRAYTLQLNSCLSRNLELEEMCIALRYWLYSSVLPEFRVPEPQKIKQAESA